MPRKLRFGKLKVFRLRPGLYQVFGLTPDRGEVEWSVERTTDQPVNWSVVEKNRGIFWFQSFGTFKEAAQEIAEKCLCPSVLIVSVQYDEGDPGSYRQVEVRAIDERVWYRGTTDPRMDLQAALLWASGWTELVLASSTVDWFFIELESQGPVPATLKREAQNG